MNLPFLQSLGLTPGEIELYELLLRIGEVPVQTIQEETRLKRPTIYKTLYSLQKKKLVTSKDIRKKIHFRPAPPRELMSLVETQTTEIERARSSLQAFLPNLTSSYILAIEKPVVTTFEGVEGLKKMFDDQVHEGKPIFALLNTSVVEPELFKWLTTVHVKQRAKAGIPAKVIISSGEWSDEYKSLDAKELRETRIVPSIRFPFQHEVDVYGNKVSFINYKKGEALIGVMINHPLIAQTMKAMFDLTWIGAEQVKLSSSLK